jgi:hypothetical protein
VPCHGDRDPLVMGNFLCFLQKGKTVLQMFYEIFNLLVKINVAWLAMRLTFRQNYLFTIIVGKYFFKVVKHHLCYKYSVAACL